MEQIGGGAMGQRRRQQETVPVEPVDAQTAPPKRAQTRQIVCESRPRIGAHFQNLGLGKGGMQRIGGVEQLHDRARGDAVQA